MSDFEDRHWEGTLLMDEQLLIDHHEQSFFIFSSLLQNISIFAVRGMKLCIVMFH